MCQRGLSVIGRIDSHSQPDGRLMEGSPSHNDDGFSTFFSETGNGKHVPRSLYVSAARKEGGQRRTGKWR